MHNYYYARIIMNIICKKNDLLNNINIVLKAVPNKTTMPILECIIIDAKNDNVTLIANNLELGIKTMLSKETQINDTGSIALNAKVFSDIIRKLSDNDVSIVTDENFNVTITCGKAKFQISYKGTEEFPMLPIIKKEKQITISQFILKDIIRQTVFSISDNESNKLMTGELFEVNKNELKVVSLDGNRISIRKIYLKESYDQVKVIVPGKMLNEISKILSGGIDDNINMFFTNKYIMFEYNDTTIVSRLIEGEYFKIEQMLSNDYETKIVLNKKEFLDCIERATLMIKESDKRPIIINITDNLLELRVNSQIGSMNEEIDITKEGKDIMIGFNPRFLIDALKVIDDEEINIYLFNPKAPCFIKNNDETYIYLILPVNFNI